MTSGRHFQCLQNQRMQLFLHKSSNPKPLKFSGKWFILCITYGCKAFPFTKIGVIETLHLNLFLTYVKEEPNLSIPMRLSFCMWCSWDTRLILIFQRWHIVEEKFQQNAYNELLFNSSDINLRLNFSLYINEINLLHILRCRWNLIISKNRNYIFVNKLNWWW